MNDTFHGKTALITGASAGIGAEFARQLSAKGANLVLVARRVDRLDILAQELTKKHGINCTVIAMDLSDTTASASLFEATHKIEVDILVNNAGYALKSTFSRVALKDISDQLQVMLTSLTELCHWYLPGMIHRQYGRIINVASLAAFTPDFSGSLYPPIKAYVLRLSRSLSLELRKTNVNVTALCPGYTYSEFHDVQGTRAKMNRLPRFMWMDSDKVVRQGISAAEKGKSVHINGTVNRVITGMCTLLPHGLMHGMMPGRSTAKKRTKLNTLNKTKKSSGEKR